MNRTAILCLLAGFLLAGCSSRERLANELLERKLLLEIIRTSPTTTMVLGETDQEAFRDACVRAIMKGLTKEELEHELAFARTELGGKEAAFQLQMIQTSLMGKYPAEQDVAPACLSLARELIEADPMSDRLGDRVTGGIARCAAHAFNEDELKTLLARTQDPLAVAVQRKWPQIVTQAFQEVAKQARRE
jgi:hypothetical protein